MNLNEDTSRDAALITLTEKIVESGGKVSDAMGLMGENLIELSEAENRVEDKLDKLRVEMLKSHETALTEFSSQMKKINTFMEKLEASGLLEFVKTIKKFLSIITIAIISGAAWLIFNGLLKFYVTVILKSSVPH
jgi:hypothetical protein